MPDRRRVSLHSPSGLAGGLADAKAVGGAKEKSGPVVLSDHVLMYEMQLVCAAVHVRERPACNFEKRAPAISSPLLRKLEGKWHCDS